MCTLVKDNLIIAFLAEIREGWIEINGSLLNRKPIFLGIDHFPKIKSFDIMISPDSQTVLRTCLFSQLC